MPTSSRLWDRVLQIVTILIFSALAYFFLKEGVGLVSAGVKGEWNVLMEFTGMKLYITSVVPGVAVVFGGVALMLWALPKVMKCLK